MKNQNHNTSLISDSVEMIVNGKLEISSDTITIGGLSSPLSDITLGIIHNTSVIKDPEITGRTCRFTIYLKEDKSVPVKLKPSEDIISLKDVIRELISQGIDPSKVAFVVLQAPYAPDPQLTLMPGVWQSIFNQPVEPAGNVHDAFADDNSM